MSLCVCVWGLRMNQISRTFDTLRSNFCVLARIVMSYKYTGRGFCDSIFAKRSTPAKFDAPSNTVTECAISETFKEWYVWQLSKESLLNQRKYSGTEGFQGFTGYLTHLGMNGMVPFLCTFLHVYHHFSLLVHGVLTTQYSVYRKWNVGASQGVSEEMWTLYVGEPN